MNTSEITDTRKRQLDEYSIFLISELKHQETFEPELLTEFIKMFSQRILNDFSLSDALSALYEYCQACHNLNFVGKDLNSAEMIRSLYSIYGLYFNLSDLKKEQSSEKELLAKLRSGHGISILIAIRDNPGIIHKDLAAKVNISASALSQFVTKYLGYKLFSTIAAGREKAYYIEFNGLHLLENANTPSTTSVSVINTVIKKPLPEVTTYGSNEAEKLKEKLKKAEQKIAELREKNLNLEKENYFLRETLSDQPNTVNSLFSDIATSPSSRKKVLSEDADSCIDVFSTVPDKIKIQLSSNVFSTTKSFLTTDKLCKKAAFSLNSGNY